MERGYTARFGYYVRRNQKEQAYAAAGNLDLSKSKTIKFLFTIRGLSTNDMTLEGFSNQVKFTLLEEIQNEEFIWCSG